MEMDEMHYRPRHYHKHYLQEGQMTCWNSKEAIGQIRPLPKARKLILSITSFTLAILVLMSCMYLPASAAAGRTDKELQTLINECIEKKETAHQMAECARALGYSENHTVIQIAKQEWAEQEELQTAYTAELKAYNEKMAKKRAEAPYATEIYEKLREHGLSHVTASAIMGNVMAEVGGQTLEHINPFIYANGYYGMCMWSIYYNPKVIWLGIDGQLDYLFETMPSVMSQFGGSYEYFKSITDVRQAARYFCSYYERGTGLTQRANNAVKALEYYS